MFAARLVAATIATIVLMAAIFVMTVPPERAPGTAAYGPPARRIPTPTLYQEHCSLCHGESGDGHGPTELERPARSFLTGGYTYGNTLQAVMRTITSGIPGTAMPAFGESLSDQQRSSLARYVLDKGPRGTVVQPSEGVLEVGDRPLLVQGMAPDPITNGTFEPRCLNLGFPNGTSFQYRQRDLALLATREGKFLDRTDWRGGGGAPLRLLGKIDWQADAAARDRADFVHATSSAPLRRALRRTSIGADWVLLEFRLLDADGVTVGAGAERVAFVSVGRSDVATRTLFVTDAGSGAALRKVSTDGTVSTGGRGSGLKTAKASDHLLVATPNGRDDVLVYVHAKSWSKKLARSVATLIERVE